MPIDPSNQPRPDRRGFLLRGRGQREDQKGGVFRASRSGFALGFALGARACRLRRRLSPLPPDPRRRPPDPRRGPPARGAADRPPTPAPLTVPWHLNSAALASTPRRQPPARGAAALTLDAGRWPGAAAWPSMSAAGPWCRGRLKPWPWARRRSPGLDRSGELTSRAGELTTGTKS